MENVIAGILLFLGGAVVLGLLVAWPVMVLWGAVSDDLGLPTIGLGTAWQLSLLTTLLFKSSSSDD